MQTIFLPFNILSFQQWEKLVTKEKNQLKKNDWSRSTMWKERFVSIRKEKEKQNLLFSRELAQFEGLEIKAGRARQVLEQKSTRLASWKEFVYKYKN